ncbi:MAG: hypothetical protein IJM54_09230 [Thermoguttaceae bacterium]|nr:hypothetical protein [Thermoguttaceae bacterium]
MNVYSYVLTCSRTKDRLRGFFDSWNAARADYCQKNPDSLDSFKIDTVWGMNAERFPRSPWWRVGAVRAELPDRQTGNGLDRRGHTACYWGHVQEWRQALGEHDDEFKGCAAFFFEDDCRFDVDFFSRVEQGFLDLPDDWDIFYAGGQLCVNGRPRPLIFSENLYKVDNVNRTHAYCVRLSSLPKIILWFEEHWDWGHNFRDAKTGQSEAEVDYALGSLTESGFLNGYALRRWACGQAPGFSQTQGRFQQNGRWELF